MTAESYDQIRVWHQYHQSIGVSIFYLFVDGQAAHPEVQAQLALLPGVTVIPRDEQLVQRQAHSRIWNETWLAAFFHKPCNHELFVRQSLNMESKPPASSSANCSMPVTVEAEQFHVDVGVMIGAHNIWLSLCSHPSFLQLSCLHSLRWKAACTLYLPLQSLLRMNMHAARHIGGVYHQSAC